MTDKRDFMSVGVIVDAYCDNLSSPRKLSIVLRLGDMDNRLELSLPSRDDIFECEQTIAKVFGTRQGEDAAGVIVVMEYGSGNLAVWSATIHQIDEDILCPWSVSLTFKGYSPTVTIDCPDNTPVHFWNPKSQKWQNTDCREED